MNDVSLAKLRHLLMTIDGESQTADEAIATLFGWTRPSFGSQWFWRSPWPGSDPEALPPNFTGDIKEVMDLAAKSLPDWWVAVWSGEDGDWAASLDHREPRFYIVEECAPSGQLALLRCLVRAMDPQKSDELDRSSDATNSPPEDQSSPTLERLRAFGKALGAGEWTSALLLAYNPTAGTEVSYEAAKAALVTDLAALGAAPAGVRRVLRAWDAGREVGARATRRGLEADLQLAVDLLTERKYGSPARSAGHNARLVIERALKTLAAQP